MKPARLLRWYPRAWRDRYGEELLALIQDTAEEGRPAWRLRAGLAWGGLRERGHQAARAGKAAVKPLARSNLMWIISAGGTAAGLPTYLSNLQHPGPGWQAAAFDGVLAVIGLTGAVMLAGGLAGLPALVRFVRAGGWPTIRRQAGWAAGATVVAGGGLAGLAVFASSHPPNAQLPNSVAVDLGAASIATALVVAAAIGLWVTTAAGRLTLAPRVRSFQLMLGAVLPSAAQVILAALTIWVALTQGTMWLILVPVQLGGAGLLAWTRLQVAIRKDRKLRAAVRRLRAQYPDRKITVTAGSPDVVRVTVPVAAQGSLTSDGG